MKPKKKSFRIHAPLQDNILSLTAILSLIAVTIAAVVFVLWLLFQTGLLSAELLEPQPGLSVSETDGPSIYDILRPLGDTDSDTAAADQQNNVIRFSGDFSTLRTLLADMDTPDDYMIEFETTLYSGTESAQTTVRIYASGEQFRIERYASESASPTETYLSDGSTVVYQNHETGETASFPSSDAFSMEALAGVPSLRSFTDVPDENLLHASYAEIGEQIVYYVQFYTTDALDAKVIQEYWITAESEFVIRCRTYSGVTEENPKGTVVFSCNMKTTRTLTDKERASLFLLPEET